MIPNKVNKDKECERCPQTKPQWVLKLQYTSRIPNKIPLKNIPQKYSFLFAYMVKDIAICRHWTTDWKVLLRPQYLQQQANIQSGMHQ